MIGFEMTATGSNNFKEKRGAWTEGSMMALKIIATADHFANKTKIGKVQRGAISSIEKNFKKIADTKFAAICSFGLNFTLFVTGDIKFKFRFESGKNSAQTQRELYHLFAANSDGGTVGDQVMIYFCAIVEDFVTLNFDKTGQDLFLTINIDL